MKITVEKNGYEEIIKNYLLKEIPQAIHPTDDISEIILSELLATREIRQGAKPSILHQANIIKDIKAAINNSTPIPILIGSGPKKTLSGESIDLAEFYVLKTLNCLNNNIKKYYPLGISVSIRLEDYTGYVLEPKNEEASISKYIDDFKKLSYILGYDFINIYTEGDFVDMNTFMSMVNNYQPTFLHYLLATMEEEDVNKYKFFPKALEGWKGIIPDIMRTYLIERYKRSYPNLTEYQYIEMMSRYFAATYVRHLTKSTGNVFDTNPIQLSFIGAVPGISEDLHSNRIYYRTVPMSNTKVHLPFWRAKGYFKITENNDVRISLSNWYDLPQDLQENYINLERSNTTLSLKADYLLIN